ncbi:hypothetical protein N7462_000385 [Penicillium macrosclerotiorum]|uniref:uncharacterized protein n=1 Tax=Penicillium macrosclerotiorum TaxID=303699 RepID=UPI002548B775|nr:uncharacterized protein N7462_000385 [Penicillium macrosclerotiorum]KAJ5698380.1 hypothetical protein N7462_000385 [Penicillium macrosclerotiorum]
MAALLGLNFVVLHFAYFIILPAIGSVIFYTASTQIHDLRYVDALFMTFSAMTGTGLNLDLSTLNLLQQGILFTLLIFGHAIPILAFVSFFHARSIRSAHRCGSTQKQQKQGAYEKSTTQIQIKQLRQDTHKAPSVLCLALPKISTKVEVTELSTTISSPPDLGFSKNRQGLVFVNGLNNKNHNEPTAPTTLLCVKKGICRRVNAGTIRVVSRLKRIWQRRKITSNLDRSISWDEATNIEYQAILLVSTIVIFYFLTLLFLGIIGLGLWFKFYHPDFSHRSGLGLFWTGAFLATSAFSNNGMSLIDANMIPFQRE